MILKVLRYVTLSVDQIIALIDLVDANPTFAALPMTSLAREQSLIGYSAHFSDWNRTPAAGEIVILTPGNQSLTFAKEGTSLRVNTMDFEFSHPAKFVFRTGGISLRDISETDRMLLQIIHPDI